MGGKLLNVVIVTYEFPPRIGVCGIGSYSHKLAHALAERGHQVHVISHVAPDDAPEQTIRQGKVLVHQIREPNWTKRFSLLKVFAYRWRIRQKVFELHEHMSTRAHEHMVVEIPNWVFEGLFLSLINRPFSVVCRLHTPTLENESYSGGKLSFKMKVLGWLEQLAVRRSDAQVTSSQYYKEKSVALYGLDPDNISVVPLGTTIPSEDELSIAVSNDAVNVLFVGRLENRKGTRFLMDAIPKVLEQYPETRFTFAGKDLAGYGQYFKKLSQGRFDHQVDVLGFVPDEDLRKLYQRCDILCAPSLSESFGLIFIEAMSWGKPVVACDVCAVSNIVEHGKSGLLVKPEDSQAIAGALITMIADPEKRRRMGERGRVICEEKFSVRQMARGMEEFYSRSPAPQISRSPGQRALGTGR